MEIDSDEYLSHLNIRFLLGTREITVFCASLIGASLGFLWFNALPAQVYMGDTGALALGAGFAVVAILIKKSCFVDAGRNSRCRIPLGNYPKVLLQIHSSPFRRRGVVFQDDPDPSSLRITRLNGIGCNLHQPHAADHERL